MKKKATLNKSLFINIFDHFLFSSFYIAVCAVLMVYQSYRLFHTPTNIYFILFVFFSTLCSYNLHWYFTPSEYGGSYKTQWSVNHKPLHLILFIISAIGAGLSILPLLHHWLWLLATGFITFLYTAPKIPFKPLQQLKKIAIGKTIFLAFAWTHITSFLPLILHHAVLSKTEEIFVINRFFLIYPICILFDYRDKEEDKLEGIKSMITDLNDKGIDIVFWGSLIAFFATSILLYSNGTPLHICFALFIPGLLVALLQKPSKRNFSDYLYYFILDGLMMFSSILLLLF